MPVVSDTGPINYLVWVGFAEVLPMLYRQLLIPPAVLAELSHPKTPQAIRDWLSSSPVWLQVVHPKEQGSLDLSHLGLGEQEAIALAVERRTNLLLIDERDGTKAARQHGIVVTGTLGILDQAASRGWINLAVAFDRLKQTSFRCPHALMSILLEDDKQRKQKLY